MGLDWLMRHQDEDGKWDWIGYTRHCRQGRCNCPHGVDPGVAKEGRNFSIGLTGLALLGFLGSGYTHMDLPPEKKKEVSPNFLKRHAFYKETVQKAVAFLLKTLQPDGCFTPPEQLNRHFEGYMYNQGICTLAILEAYQLTRDPQLCAAGQCAVDFICKAQGRRGGWDYCSFDRPEGRRSRRTDVSVSSWQIMALKSAIDAGLRVDPRVLNLARRYFRKMTRRTGSYRYAVGKRGKDILDVSDEHTRRESIGVTAAGMLSAMYLGASLDSKGLKDGAALLLSDRPNPDKVKAPKAKGDEYNFHTVYYWYYGSLVMYHLGKGYWSLWKTDLARMLKRTQNTGEARGSWDPRGTFLGTYAGRLYVTTFNILTRSVLPIPPALQDARDPKDSLPREVEEPGSPSCGREESQGQGRDGSHPESGGPVRGE
jgi:hypothetical protein